MSDSSTLAKSFNRVYYLGLSIAGLAAIKLISDFIKKKSEENDIDDVATSESESSEASEVQTDQDVTLELDEEAEDGEDTQRSILKKKTVSFASGRQATGTKPELSIERAMTMGRSMTKKFQETDKQTGNVQVICFTGGPCAGKGNNFIQNHLFQQYPPKRVLL